MRLGQRFEFARWLYILCRFAGKIRAVENVVVLKHLPLDTTRVHSPLVSKEAETRETHSK
jgi:hypothetical protein